MKETPLGLKVLAAVGALVVVPGGAFLAIANVGTGGKVAIAAGVVWWLVASAVLGKTLLKRKPDLRTPVRVTLAVAAVASIAAGYVATRGNTVDEDIVTAAPAAEAGQAPESAPAKEAPAQNVQLLSGTFSGESGHSGEGRAAVVKLAEGGRVITFSSFDVDPGAGDLRVYLHEGKSTSDDLGDFVEIAKLKGSKGDQQYEIPSKLDLGRHDTVVIWCVPFSTRIAQAPLSG